MHARLLFVQVQPLTAPCCPLHCSSSSNQDCWAGLVCKTPFQTTQTQTDFLEFHLPGYPRRSPVTGALELHYPTMRRASRMAVSAAATGLLLALGAVLLVCLMNLQVGYMYCMHAGPQPWCVRSCLLAAYMRWHACWCPITPRHNAQPGAHACMPRDRQLHSMATTGCD